MKEPERRRAPLVLNDLADLFPLTEKRRLHWVFRGDVEDVARSAERAFFRHLSAAEPLNLSQQQLDLLVAGLMYWWYTLGPHHGNLRPPSFPINEALARLVAAGADCAAACVALAEGAPGGGGGDALRFVLAESPVGLPFDPRSVPMPVPAMERPEVGRL